MRKGHGTRQYFFRRFRRIYPPFWAFLVVVSCFLLTPIGHSIIDGVGVHDPRELSAAAWFGNMTLTETWLPNVTGREQPTFVTGHAWSLCYEEQFYFVVGLLLLLCPRRFFTGCAVVTGLTLILWAVLPRIGISAHKGTFLDLSWLAFAAGLWVYHHRVRATGLSKAALTLLPIVGLAFSLRHPGDPDVFLLAAFAFAMILAAISPLDDKLADSRFVRPLTWCGLMCYSLYLVHLPVTHTLVILLEDYGALVTVPICIISSIAIGFAFHFVIERRFLNSAQYTSGPSARPKIAELAVPR
jgi:peptidoglycan/LPS O-acetylase OafA/YrhL